MEVRLTPDQEAFVRQGIAAGRFQNEADAVAEAMALWEERERARKRFWPLSMRRTPRWIAGKESSSLSSRCASWLKT
jgi:Arc/MetJ-type ribon-helix-helix transcriptional regulator